ncbi:MAG TPA: biopolymer transporter ExbD [Opitutales bacterium]|nr:biopolymer transporter ExbD [Opitutales bacterium]
MQTKDILGDGEKANLTPMIDVVFLLLIFFMVTTSLIKEEADLGIQLPTDTRGDPSEQLPSKHIIDVMPDGSIRLNGGQIASGSDSSVVLSGLITTLQRLKASSDPMGVKTIVIIQADPVSPHYKSVQVLDACAAADIQYVSFANI